MAASLPSGTRLVRLAVPANMVNLDVTTPASYSCFIAAPQTVDCATTEATSLAPGGHMDIKLLGTAQRDPGPLSITATADPLNVVPQGDESDNEATDTVTVQPPAFSATLSGSPDPVDALATSNWSAKVTNDGPAPQTVDCATTGTANITAGGTVDITLFGRAPSSPGTLSVTATAGPLDVVPEGDETNNAATDEVSVS